MSQLKLKCIQRVRAKAESMGCTLDADASDTVLIVDAPRGMLFKDSGTLSVIVPCANFAGQTWYRDACREAMEALDMGLEPDTEGVWDEEYPEDADESEADFSSGIA